MAVLRRYPEKGRGARSRTLTILLPKRKIEPLSPFAILYKGCLYLTSSGMTGKIQRGDIQSLLTTIQAAVASSPDTSDNEDGNTAACAVQTTESAVIVCGSLHMMGFLSFKRCEEYLASVRHSTRIQFFPSPVSPKIEFAFNFFTHFTL